MSLFHKHSVFVNAHTFSADEAANSVGNLTFR